MRTPFYSVLVPVYNHEQYIGAALDSLIAQTDEDWEALVVDDGSSDRTPGIIEDYMRRDGRIRAFHKLNGGQSSALNAGLQNARGEWICWLSSDDLFLPDKLSTHRKWIGAFSGRRFFYTGFEMLEDESGAITPAYVDHTTDRHWQVLDLLSFNYINGITICGHRSLFEQMGGFNDANRYGQDYDMFLRILSQEEGIRIPEPTCLSRVHARQFTRTESLSMFYDCASAAIDFLGRTSFASLFPQLDLSDESCAFAAVDRALDVAMQPEACVNRLGPHPLLFAKIMEWVVGQPGRAGRRMRALVEWRVRAVATREKSVSRWSSFWRAAALLVSVNPAQAGVVPCTPLSTADAALADLSSRGDAAADTVRKFIEKRQGREPHESPPPRPPPRELLVDDAVAEESLQELARWGWRVTRVDLQTDGLSLHEWGWTVGVRSARRSVSAALASLPLWEVAVFGRRSAGILAVACRTVPLPSEPTGLEAPITKRLDGPTPVKNRTKTVRLLRQMQWRAQRLMRHAGRESASHRRARFETAAPL